MGKYHFEFVRECTPRKRPSLHSTTHVYRQRAPALVMRQIGPPCKNVGWTTLLVSKSKKTYPTVRRYGTRPQKVSHRYGSDKYHNPAQGGFVPSRLAQQSFHGLPHDKLSIRIVSPPRQSNQSAGQQGFPTVHSIIRCLGSVFFTAKRTALVIPATPIRETLRYVTLLFLENVQVDKITTARVPFGRILN